MHIFSPLSSLKTRTKNTKKLMVCAHVHYLFIKFIQMLHSQYLQWLLLLNYVWTLTFL